MAWKTDNNNQVVVQDGHPVWVYDDGKESPFDAGSALQKIGSVTAESVARKNRIKELETKLEPFSTIDNPSEFITQAREALNTLQNLKDKEIMEAGEVEAIKKRVAESYEGKIKDIEKSLKFQIEERERVIKSKDDGIHKLLIEGAFMQSEFLRHKTVWSPDLTYAKYGSMFTVKESDNGELMAVALDQNGNEILSRREAGSPASVDEVLESIVNSRKDKDSILRGNQSGSGSKPNVSVGSFSRDEMMRLPPKERIDMARRRQQNR